MCVLARAEASSTGQALLQKKYMVSVRGSGLQEGSFEEGKDALYRLLEDDPNSALNAGQTAACSPIPGRSGLWEPPPSLRRLVDQRSPLPLLSTLLAWFVCRVSELSGRKN